MKKINKILSNKSKITMDNYMDIVLYDKKFGYYQKKNPFGIKGDYVTAPNISNLFCEMIVIWLVSFWENLKKPNNFVFNQELKGKGVKCSFRVCQLIILSFNLVTTLIP